MSSKVIATILNLKDNMSGGLMRVSRNTQNMSKEMKRASQQAVSFANNAKKHFESIGDKAVKMTAGIVGVVGGLALKGGFSEALNMEGYKVQLETAVKDTVKAGQLMKDAVKFANVTPFETGEVIEATSKLEMMGISSKKWLKDVADMSGSTNKSMLMGTEALIDAQTGEFERLKEFGIRKDDIMLKSAKKYGAGVVFDSKGHMLDQVKMMDILQEIMQSKYKGGAEKLAGTTKGMWSTITGITKSSLAKIVGMQDDGTIKVGSLLDTVKGKVKQVADQFQKMQDDGSIQKIADTATNTFNKLLEVISKVFNFIKNNKTIIENVALAFAGFYVAIKIIKALSAVVYGLEIAMAVLSGASALTWFGWVAIAITALIVVGALLWKNWDVIKAKTKELVDKITPLKDSFIELKDKLIDIKDKAIQGVIDKFNDFKDAIIKNKDEIKITAGILGTIFGPALIVTGTQAIIAGAKIASSFIASVVTTGVQAVISAGKVTISFIASIIETGVQAVIAAPKIIATFVASLITTAAQSIATGVAITVNLIGSLIMYVVKGWETVTVIAAQTVAWIAQNVVMIASAVATGAMTVAQWAFNAAVAANPMTWVVIAIVAAVALLALGVYEVVKHWDSVKAAAGAAWEYIKQTFANVGQWFDKNVIQPLLSIIPDWLKNFFMGKKTDISVNTNYTGKSTVDSLVIPKHAKGTSYAPGGLSLVGEKGPELVNLRKGDTVTTADKTEKLLNSNKTDTSKQSTIKTSNGNVYTINFHGAIVREKSDIDEIVDSLIKKLNDIEPNMA